MARVVTRFYVFGILLVASTIYLPHPGPASATGLAALAIVAAGIVFFILKFPWDSFEPRIFTLTHLLSSSIALFGLTVSVLYAAKGSSLHSSLLLSYVQLAPRRVS